ncbi:MAG: DeoR family transcriptional regulator [Glaciihabitans sp.]|jgi:DeoR/GlpR family transcriptional regulator of sugar metabolism|nr:DeoR family transcriptional regulator [Glaciihabitans sp.]
MTTVAARKETIRQRVAKSGEVLFRELAAEFGVSEMTIRRDIEVLESEGVVRKVIGGAIAVGKAQEPPFAVRSESASEHKRLIAESIVTMLSPGESVILDSGSTVLAVARAIRGKDLGLTILTPSTLVAIELAEEPNTSIILTGGNIRPGELSLIGPDAVDSVSRYNLETFIMGISGVDPVRGFTDYHREEGYVKMASIRAADRLIVAADQSKLGQTHFMNVAPLSAASAIVTDGTPQDPTLIAAASLGVDVIFATSTQS